MACPPSFANVHNLFCLTIVLRMGPCFLPFCTARRSTITELSFCSGSILATTKYVLFNTGFLRKKEQDSVPIFFVNFSERKQLKAGYICFFYLFRSQNEIDCLP